MKKESLGNKWKALENLDLFGEVKSIVKLRPNQPNLSEKSLNELHEEVETYIKWYSDRSFYINDKSLECIQALVQTFLSVTDIEALKTTLKLILKLDGNSWYFKLNKLFSKNNYCGRTVEHYFTQVIKKGEISSMSNKLRYNYIKLVKQFLQNCKTY